MHENIIKQQQVLFITATTDLITDPRSFTRASLVFLPCIEVIPEHTDRAARIKQSRVKMMRLKAKNRKRRTRIGRGGERERKREKKKYQRISRGGG